MPGSVLGFWVTVSSEGTPPTKKEQGGKGLEENSGPAGNTDEE